MDDLTKKLVNTYQRDFPIESRPFLKIANDLGVTENEVIFAISELKNSNILSRLGPVFNHKKAGASTLAAMSVPLEKLQETATYVNSFKQVNHNYEREHAINLWFVVTAPTQEEVETTLQEMEKSTGYAVLNLPMETAYHIDLGFSIHWGATCDTPLASNY